MKLFLIGFIIIIVLAVILYIALNYLYDFLIHNEKKLNYKKEIQTQKRNYDLQMANLLKKQVMLQNEIKHKSATFVSHAEVTELENELNKVNKIIKDIQSEGKDNE